mmetsp:Transcript_103003/g.182970  ORF Transcript_103003/g.182970 Transcript_103003/m.182970 type:complete len:147 (-) Transcript_103003:83-523(-)
MYRCCLSRHQSKLCSPLTQMTLREEILNCTKLPAVVGKTNCSCVLPTAGAAHSPPEDGSELPDSEISFPQSGQARRHSPSHLLMQSLWKECPQGKLTARSLSSKTLRQTEQDSPASFFPQTFGRLSMLEALAVGLATVSSRRSNVS